MCWIRIAIPICVVARSLGAVQTVGGTPPLFRQTARVAFHLRVGSHVPLLVDVLEARKPVTNMKHMTVKSKLGTRREQFMRCYTYGSKAVETRKTYPTIKNKETK